MRPFLTTLLALTIALGGLLATPAQALPRVGMVQAAGVTSSSVTLTWPKYRGAKTYRVHRAANYAFTKGLRVTKAKTNRATVRGLRSGVEYCFKVRAYNRKGQHVATSARTCKPAAAISVPRAGAPVSTMTYNICSQVCDRRPELRMKPWSVRRGVVTNTILRSGADVVALQESFGWKTIAGDLRSAYTVVPEFGYYQVSTLAFRTSRFEQVVDTVTYGDGGETVVETTPRAATINLPNGKRATWSELRDRRTGRKTVFVSAHISDQTGSAANARRRVETRSLLVQVGAANTHRSRVVYLGDFNSNKSRGHAGDTPARVMGSAGYLDAYDQARTLTRPNFNSVTKGALKPVRSFTHGDHIDKVWVRRGDGIGVESWANANPIRGTKYVGPLGSDHCPILVRLRMS
ncbi:fibronectin type III domain-containing protein [Aeromicrobium flavum]|nr:endonuclease/exonuclease/phosphatase family protein [Aeromicrobium flavum]